MPVDERFNGRSGGGVGTLNAWAELTFLALDDYADAPAAITAVLTASPSSYGGLRRESVSDWKEILGEKGYEVTVRYSQAVLTGETGQSSFSFRTSGGTMHITQGIKTKGLWRVLLTGETLQDPPGTFGGAISPTRDGVEGADIVVPVYQFEETHYKAASEVTTAYKATLIQLTGTMNKNAFKGLAAGEGLFLGCDGHETGDDQWQLTYSFAGQPNRTGIQIGDIVGISKRGWDALWVRYRDDVDGETNVLVKAPFIVGVEQVYYEADWAALGIGT